nr:hypothetical protein [Marinicella sp. W31]MDC2877791.1 hypothetical protein [Marinicella sp. W31]
MTADYLRQVVAETREMAALNKAKFAVPWFWLFADFFLVPLAVLLNHNPFFITKAKTLNQKNYPSSKGRVSFAPRASSPEAAAHCR